MRWASSWFSSPWCSREHCWRGSIKKLIEAVGLRPVDRTLGAAFGLVRGAVLLLAVAVVVNMSPARRAAWWTESKGAGVSLAALKGLKPVLPERFGQYLPG